MDLVLLSWEVRGWESLGSMLLVRLLLLGWLVCGVWMILMVVFAIGDYVFALLLYLSLSILFIWEKAMEFWGSGIHIRFLRLTLTNRVGWDLFKEACGTCTYGSFCHVSNIEDIITLLLDKSSPTLPSFLHLPNICSLFNLRQDLLPATLTASSVQSRRPVSLWVPRLLNV